MPRKRKYTSLTKRDIEILSSPVGVITTIGVIMFFCIIPLLIIFLSTWLENIFEMSSKVAFNLTLALIFSLILLTLVSIAGIYIFIVIKRNQEIEKKYRAIQIANIDSMDGIDFEHYLKRLLTHRGYNVRVTPASGDFGVDLVASKNNDNFAIQAKRYNTKVSRRAISDVVGGLRHYGCNRAVVVTNNYFTPDAIELAQSNGCILIDRDTLAKWIIEYQNSNI